MKHYRTVVELAVNPKLLPSDGRTGVDARDTGMSKNVEK